MNGGITIGQRIRDFTFSLERLQESQALAVLLRFSGLTLARGMTRIRAGGVACCWKLPRRNVAWGRVVFLHEMGCFGAREASRLSSFVSS